MKRQIYPLIMFTPLSLLDDLTCIGTCDDFISKEISTSVDPKFIKT